MSCSKRLRSLGRVIPATSPRCLGPRSASKRNARVITTFAFYSTCAFSFPLLFYAVTEFYLQQCVRAPEARRLDLKTFLNRPAEHLAKYELTLDAIAKETVDGNPDLEYLREAGMAFKNLQGVCSLQVWPSLHIVL